jgi:hypothetical protein
MAHDVTDAITVQAPAAFDVCTLLVERCSGGAVRDLMD